MGFLGLYTPESHGGLGLSRLDSAIVFEELAAGHLHRRLSHHPQYGELDDCQLRQRHLAGEWVPRMVSGEVLGSYCLTEPGAGSDAASLKTRAEKKGEVC
jgi:alkylation response protein AidB-like acyl-CoA dehydrogenase